MLPPELQPRSFRPYISPSISAPSFNSNNINDAYPSPNYSPSTSSSHTRARSASTGGGAGGSSPFQSRSLKSSSTSRFSPSSFVHNARIAVALVPCAVFLIDLGGTPVIATLTLGLMLAYILDSLNFKPGSFFAVWFSLIAAQIAFFFSSSLISTFNSVYLGILASLACAITNFLIGIWVSLQFKWIQIEYPTIVLALERLLFACVPIIASSIFTWATVSAVGMFNAAYYLMAFSCVFYWLFAIPRVSAFKVKQQVSYHGGEVPDESLILGQLESCFHTLHLLFIPFLFHTASHYSLIFSSVASVVDLVLLFCIPFLLQLYASTRGALWWVTKNEGQLRSIRLVNGAIVLVAVVISLEIRVVFHSFGRYIQVPPPLNYLLVTITMLGGAAAACAYALGMVSDAFSSVIFTSSAVVVSAAGAVVIGFPVLFIPLPSVTGFYLARFFTKKSLSSYFAFVVLGSLMVTWFVMHNYWDLNIWMAGMSLKSFCKLIVGSVILAMAVPGLALLPPKLHFLAEAGLVSHALLLCYVENRFFTYSNVYYYGMEDEVIYPSYMVIMTTFLGLALVRRLSVDNRIGPKAVWILTCLYCAKLAMLLMASKTVVWVSAVLLLAVSPPVLLYKDKSRTASKMKPWQGYAHAGVVALSVWLFRETIFEALQWWNGRSPSDGLLLGACILLMGVACVPIVALHFSHEMSAKRCLLLVIATGVLFILMQPPIPMSWTYRSDLIRAARQSSDDISIYGFMASKPTWPAWLLIAAILLTLAAISSVLPIKYFVELRVFYSIAVGIALGVYISAEYFLQTAMLHILIVVTMICTSLFVVFTHLPSASSTKLLPWVFALLVALFPVTYLLEGQIRNSKSLLVDEVGEMELEDNKLATLLAVEGARTSLLGLYAAIFMLIALEIKFELASLLREKVTERGGLRHSQSSQSGSAGAPPRSRFMQHLRSSTVPTFTIKKIAAEGAWMPAVGNVATIMCFAICLILNVNLTGGSNRAIFFLAPILLLLNQDSDFVAGFGDKQRYFPVTAAISGYLVLTALYTIWEEVWHGNAAGWGIDIGGPDWFFAVKNLALLILTFPSHILFTRFVWSYTKQTDSGPLLTIPLNIPAIIITDVLKVKILGLLGIIYSLAQYLISRQQQISGMKYI
ncbi:OLC1v1028515C1 [Oldenlandia corymbosa var. corymbosa]|uniref:OLC1v1028515C1 n=1 Tax=Oldenlandia corymbosa var. corymbosa TaxID=529605 RepID=A0AAV1CBY2_OLDCO|nr:OLC1v1028515C1 [Oldenlandia corymbosa var. corymbosa]